MVVAILGNPFVRKHALAATLAPLVSKKVVTSTELRDTIARSTTERATVARTMIAEGRLVRDALVGELLSETVADDEAIIIGRPRTLEELHAFHRASGCMLSLDAALPLAELAERARVFIEDQCITTG